MQIVSSLPFNDFICKIRYDYYEMKVILIPILCCCNNCCCSLQAKKWCSSLSSSHIDDELGDPCPKIDLGHFLLSSWWCSCPNYLDRVAHTKPYPVINQALMRLLFCKLLLQCRSFVENHFTSIRGFFTFFAWVNHLTTSACPQFSPYWGISGNFDFFSSPFLEEILISVWEKWGILQTRKSWFSELFT